MAASISATLIPCLKSFNQIQELVSRPDYDCEDDVPSVAWSDELGRLRVWAANIGAHQTGQSSLEFRLRDASHISQQITKLLKDLDGILNSITDELCDDYVEASKVITSSDDGDAWPDDGDSTSELQQLYEEVRNMMYYLGHKSDAAAFEPFDREHVRNKYLDADDVTTHRLGRAITQRRKYLKYRDRHHAKLGKGIEDVQGIQGIQRTATQSALSETIATDFKNQNIDFEETPSNSGVSQTSYAPSLMDGGSITIPPPPKNSAAGKPFECPYCFFLIDIRGKRSWARHIFKDIKPYVCTFSDCSTPDRLFESRREWFFHMTTKHHVGDLTCPLCKDILTSTKQFERHVARHLEELALFALPRNEIDDDSDEDELDARASTSGSPVDTSSVDSESSDEGDQTDDFVAVQASYVRGQPSSRQTQSDDEGQSATITKRFTKLPSSAEYRAKLNFDRARDQRERDMLNTELDGTARMKMPMRERLLPLGDPGPVNAEVARGLASQTRLTHERDRRRLVSDERTLVFDDPHGSVQPPIATTSVPAGLPSRKPSQEKPSVHPTYTPGEDIRSHHLPELLMERVSKAALKIPVKHDPQVAVERQNDHDQEQISPGPNNVPPGRAPEEASLQTQEDGARSRSDGNRVEDDYQETERLTPIKLGSSAGVTPSRTGSSGEKGGWWTCHKHSANSTGESCGNCPHMKCIFCQLQDLEPIDQEKIKSELAKHFEQRSQERRTHVERMERLDGKRAREIVDQSETASARVAREADEHEREAQYKARENARDAYSRR